MKSVLHSLLVILLLSISTKTYSEVIFESKEKIYLSLSESNLTCKWVEEAAHAGTISFPAAFLSIDSLEGTKFDHQDFYGYAYLPQEFSCLPVDNLLEQANGQGSVEVNKHVKVHKITYQDYLGGPITAIEYSETVRLTFSNGLYVTSTKSKKEKM